MPVVAPVPATVSLPSDAAAKRRETRERKARDAAAAAATARLTSSVNELLGNNVPTPPPHRRCQVGDRVVFGSHPHTVVTAVYGDGGVYRIQSAGDYPRYGNMVPEVHDHAVTWLQLLPYRAADAIPTESVVLDPTFRPLHYSQRAVSSLLGMLYTDKLDTAPVYQRALCWTGADNQLLIESVFEGRDLGKFVVVHNGFQTAPYYELLDGKQRLHALSQFYQDGFRYRGKLFSELSPRDQGKFEDAPLSYAEVEHYSQADKLKLFLRLNTAGRPQDPAWLAHVQRMLDAQVG